MRNLIKAIFLGYLIQLIGPVSCSVSCQFNTGLCGWKPAGHSLYSWRTNSGETSDRTSGPLNDVTCNNFNGYYAYLPGVYSSRGAKSELNSEVVILNKPTTFTFWYFMNGVGIGTLDVLQNYDNKTTVKLWSKHGEQNDVWHRATIELKPGTFVISFRGSADLPYGSDLAIDDVVLESENAVFNTSYCFQTSTTTSTPTTTKTSTLSTKLTTKATPSPPQTITSSPLIPTTTTRPTTIDPSLCSGNDVASERLPGSCDFENGTCDLDIRTNEEDKEVSWERIISGGIWRTAIKHDHTYQNASLRGHFLNFRNKVRFLRFDRPPIGHNASVETPVYNTSTICLSFWYIMNTKDSNLLVYMRDSSGITMNLWESHNITGNWTYKHITVQSNTPFKIGFQSRNKNFQAIVGLDDIVIHAGLDNDTETVTSTPVSSTKTSTGVTQSPPLSSSVVSQSVDTSTTRAVSASSTKSSEHSTTRTNTNPVTTSESVGMTSTKSSRTTIIIKSHPTKLTSEIAVKTTTRSSTPIAFKSTSPVITTVITSSSTSASPIEQTSRISPSIYVPTMTKSPITSSSKPSSTESQVSEHKLSSSTSAPKSTNVVTDKRTKQTPIAEPSTKLLTPTSYISTSKVSNTDNIPDETTMPGTVSSSRNTAVTSPTKVSTTTRQNLSKVNNKQTGHKYRNSTAVIGYSVGSLTLVTVIALILYLVKRSCREKKADERFKKMVNANGDNHKTFNEKSSLNGKLNGTLLTNVGISKVVSERMYENGKLNDSVIGLSNGVANNIIGEKTHENGKVNGTVVGNGFVNAAFLHSVNENDITTKF